jgi:acylphosphatase
MKTLRLFVSGTVQGVFFRRYIKEEAEKKSIRGFVRNLDDGRVEIVIEGRDERVNELIQICKKGSPHSEVKKVEINELKHQGFDSFKIMSL